MTPARKQALQWFADRGEVSFLDDSAPSRMMINRLKNDRLLEVVYERFGRGSDKHRLTKKGRKALDDFMANALKRPAPKVIWVEGNAQDGGTLMFPRSAAPYDFALPSHGLSISGTYGGGTLTVGPPLATSDA